MWIVWLSRFGAVRLVVLAVVLGWLGAEPAGDAGAWATAPLPLAVLVR